MNDATSVVILMADDDADDRLLTTMALREERLDNDVRTVCDGIELMDYLKRRGQFADPETSPTPSLILLAFGWLHIFLAATHPPTLNLPPSEGVPTSKLQAWAQSVGL